MPKTIKISFLLILMMTAILFSCKDEEEPDTYYPEVYFPVYPGSWWVYSNGETKTTASGYILHTYENDIASPYETNEAYVPYWDGHYVYGYRITQNSTEFPLKTIMNTKKNASWVVGRIEGVEVKRKTISKDVKVSIVQYPYNDPANCDTIVNPDPYDLITIDTHWNLVPTDECTNALNCDTIFIEDEESGIIYPYFYEWQITYDYDTVYHDSLIIVCDSVRTYDSVIVVMEYIEGFQDSCWISKEYFAKNIGLIKREVGSCGDSIATQTDFELIKYFINK